MTFQERIHIATAFIQLIEAVYWNSELIRNEFHLYHFPNGYETHMNQTAQRILRHIYTPTAKLIRFSPDYIIARDSPNITHNEFVWLLEYKVTRTPRYTLRENQWNCGQIEADAWDNYLNLVQSGIMLAIFIYCPYHSRPLLCGYPEESWVTASRSQVTTSRTGSKTDYINVNLNQIPTFSEFMAKYFDVPETVSNNLLNRDFYQQLLSHPLLQTAHAPNSPYRQMKTGFNWKY